MCINYLQTLLAAQYKKIGNISQLKSNQACGKCLTQHHFIIWKAEKKSFELLDDDLDIDLGECVFELQESMFPEHKWNRAVYTLEKNGHFDMEFEWDQALQDEWDKNQPK